MKPEPTPGDGGVTIGAPKPVLTPEAMVVVEVEVEVDVEVEVVVDVDVDVEVDVDVVVEVEVVDMKLACSDIGFCTVTMLVPELPV